MSEKKRSKFWDQDRKIQAVAAVRKKQMGFKKSQKMFNVSKTLHVNMKNKTSEEATFTKLERRPVFPKYMEQEIVE
jgi:thymidylate synthase